MADPMLTIRGLFAALTALFASLAVAFSSGAPSQGWESDDVLASPQVEQVPEPDTHCLEPSFISRVSDADTGGEGSEDRPNTPRDAADTSTAEVKTPGRDCLPASAPPVVDTTKELAPPATQTNGPMEPPTPSSVPTTPIVTPPPPAVTDDKAARQKRCDDAIREHTPPRFRWDNEAPNTRIGDGATGVCRPADAITPAPPAPATVAATPATPPPPAASSAPAAIPPVAPAPDATALRGKTIVVDAGHNRNNRLHTAEIGQQVDAGNGQKKACNTTGTETNDGYTEAEFTWDVSQRLVTLLSAAGVKVVTTVKDDTPWGPCVNERARIANESGAAAVISIHGDGGPATGSGFHVLEPGLPGPIQAQSHRLAIAVRDAYRSGTGMNAADYIGQDGLNPRTDMAGLNLSTIPIAMLETGNMRNSANAARMKDPAFRQLTAQSLVTALNQYLQSGK